MACAVWCWEDVNLSSVMDLARKDGNMFAVLVHVGGRLGLHIHGLWLC